MIEKSKWTIFENILKLKLTFILYIFFFSLSLKAWMVWFSQACPKNSETCILAQIFHHALKKNKKNKFLYTSELCLLWTQLTRGEKFFPLKVYSLKSKFIFIISLDKMYFIFTSKYWQVSNACMIHETW